MQRYELFMKRQTNGENICAVRINNEKKEAGCRLPCLRASCRIRTNDPEITNHVLWPTELKRRVGKLTTSRRYNQVPLLRSSPGGFRGSWPYRTYPCFVLSNARNRLRSEKHECDSVLHSLILGFAGAKVGVIFGLAKLFK